MKRQKYFFIILLITMLPVFAGCSSSGYKSADSEQGKELVTQGAAVIDVRTEMEYQQGHIEGSQLISFSELAEKAEKWPKDKMLLIVCASGSRSGAAAQMLAEKGYTEVYNLTGGLYKWPYGLVK